MTEPRPNTLPTVCVIGAGSSGIAAAKALAQSGIPFDCFEKSDRIGGLWAYRHNAGHHAAYESLHINTSKHAMQFSDFPMPADYPDYPDHFQIARYFDAYVDRFGLRDKLRLNTEVTHAARRPDGDWEVTLGDGSLHEYDALLVANGHHWNPRRPEPPFSGKFNGRQLHAHDYFDTDGFAGKNVAVVGMGNSAMDIAVETSSVAENVYLVARSGVHVLPKYAFGKPFDRLLPPFGVPWPVKKRLVKLALKAAVGPVEKYGLPKPTHEPGEAHPTVSGEILHHVSSGLVKVKPNIVELQGDRVEFEDGSTEAVDTIVYCTGYKVTFPFFDETFIAARDNDLPLYRRVFMPGVDNLFFVGLLQPLGAIMPLAEAQSKLVCDYLRGEYALPSKEKMLAQMERERTRMFKRYVPSKRHTMQVDFVEYRGLLRLERERGRLRALFAGRDLPVAARAASRRRNDPAADVLA